MNDQTKLQKMKAKIVALLAKARSTDNEAEAALFMGKAEELMAEWQLEEWNLGDVGDPMGHDMFYRATPSAPTWRRHLVTVVASYYGGKTVRRTGLDMKDTFELDVIGRESVRITVQLMVPFILEQVRAAGRKLHAEGHSGSVDQLTRRVANALVSRIHILTVQAKSKVQADEVAKAMNARALVVVKELDGYVAEQYGKLRDGVGRKRSTTSAAREAAERVSLHRQATGAGQLRLR